MSDLSFETPIEITLGKHPTASVIWLHGLGADGNDFAPVVHELDLPPEIGIRFIFPHAPFQPVTCNGGYVMRAWYDIYSLESIDQEDEAGLLHSRALIETLIAQEIERGIPSTRIILMGFSQGGAVALYTGLRHTQPLAGIGALSTYLPLHDITAAEIQSANAHIPVFIAHGLDDPVVSYRLGRRSLQHLQVLGLTPQWHEYPMQHSICMEELDDISNWILECLEKNRTED